MNYFNKLNTLTCIDDSSYKIGIFISNKNGLKSNYSAPVIELCTAYENGEIRKKKKRLLRLDNYIFDDLNEVDFSDKIEKGVISKSDWERTFTDYEVAKANVKSAYYNVQSAESGVKQSRDNLARTSIFAPRDGTISKLSVELGERVVGTAQMAGTEIVRVANLNNMEVEVDVNETDIVKVNVGDSTIVEVDAYLKREFKGVVTEIANTAENTLSVDQVTNFKVKVRILPESYKDLSADKPENSSPFRPGMTATVDIITNKKDLFQFYSS
jgi:HlyD family secretion protein